MNIITKVILFLKTLIKWVFNKNNWSTIAMGLEVSAQLSTFTENKKLASKLRYLLDNFNKLTENLQEKEKFEAAEKITKSKGILDDLKINYDLKSKTVTGSLGPIKF